MHCATDSRSSSISSSINNNQSRVSEPASPEPPPTPQYYGRRTLNEKNTRHDHAETDALF